MRTKRYFLFSALFLTWCGALTACVAEEGDQRPRATQGEYAVYSTLYIMHGEALWNLRIAVGFDAYLRQTTDADRAAVVKRFFPWTRVIERRYSGWILHDGQTESLYYYFIIKDDLLLGEPGASWLCYRFYGSEMRLLGDLTTEGDGVRYKGYPYEDGQGDWLARVRLTEKDFAVTLAGQCEYEYKSDRHGEDRWTVGCRIGTPLQWSDRENKIMAGTISVSAVLAADTPRKIEFSVEHVGNGVKIISSDGVTEFWSWMD